MTIDELTENHKELHIRIAKALNIASNYAWIDGAHHKNWVINEMIIALTTEEDREKLGWNDPEWLDECIAP